MPRCGVPLLCRANPPRRSGYDVPARPSAEVEFGDVVFLPSLFAWVPGPRGGHSGPGLLPRQFTSEGFHVWLVAYIRVSSGLSWWPVADGALVVVTSLIVHSLSLFFLSTNPHFGVFLSLLCFPCFALSISETPYPHLILAVLQWAF